MQFIGHGQISGNITTTNVDGTGIAIGHGATSIVTIYRQEILRPIPLKCRV